MKRAPNFPSVVGVVLLCAVVGRARQSPEPAADETPDEPTASAPEQSAESNGADESQAASPAMAGNRVLLGAAELTAGIPGEGELTIEQIQAWLEQPENHIPLEVQLPAGLDRAAASIYIPEDNPMTRAKIELGRQLYFDPRLSADATISCASCHDPAEGYTRHTRFGVGIGGQTGDRNSPVSYNRILSKAQFWDGRAASLEEQAKGPVENPIEMGNSHDACAETVRGIEGYRIQFEKIFPGEGVTIDNIAKAIATFERSIVTGPAPYDYYEPLRAFQKAFSDELEDLDALKEDDPDLYAQYQSLLNASNEHPMPEGARRGRELFFGKAECTACHAGANFTDENYHNLGIGMDQEEPDLGRYAVAEVKQDKDRGAFKTPTVRNVTLSAPYMHDGSLETLEQVVEWYDKGGHPNPYLSDKIKQLNLTDQEKKDLVEFMKALEGDFPPVETARLPQ